MFKTGESDVSLISANPGLFLIIFVLFKTHLKYKLKKVNVVLRIQTHGRKMVGTDGATGLLAVWPDLTKFRHFG